MIKSLATTPAYAACGSLGTILLDDFSLDQTEDTTVPSNGSFVFDTRSTPPAFTFSAGTLDAGATDPGFFLPFLVYESTAEVILPGVGDCTELVMDYVSCTRNFDYTVAAQFRLLNGSTSGWRGRYGTSPTGSLILNHVDGPALSSSPVTGLTFSPAGWGGYFIHVVSEGPLYFR
ncbi:MAG: hypothetical protein GY745_21480 [Actinomycetia bacterium]|nr:hypothetical protein [Actinomycetes bacterium]